MAELVNRHFESMVEEFEEIRRCKLLTDEELKAIQKRRKDFEYKINGVTKSLSDYKEYIEYEKFFMRTIQARRDKHRVYDRRQSIEYKIIKRIKTLYEIALMRFSSDYGFAMKFFKFCKQYNFHQVASHQLKQMVMMFSNKVEIFQVACEWFSKRDKTQALNYLHKGLFLHPQSKALYLEAIHLELREFQKEEKYDKELGCNRLITYTESIFKNVEEIRFILDVLNIFEQHRFTEKVQNYIVEKLLDKYSDDEQVWDALAKRELRGMHYNLPEGIEPVKSTKFLLERIIKTYQDGLKSVSGVKKDSLWTLYLDTLIEFQKHNPNVGKTVKLFALQNALEEAESINVNLEERHFAALIEIHMDNERKILRILEKASHDLPESILLWELYLKFYILKDNCSEVNRVFKRATIALKEEAEPIWFIIINYHLIRSSPDTVESIYLDAIKEPERVSNVFKPEYINWLVLTRGIEEARAAYNAMATKRPYCKQLHVAMAKAEALEATEDYKEWEKCLKLACEQFGKEDIDVWLQYIEFYLVHHKVFDANERIQQICRNAENALLPILKDGFREEFTRVLAES